MRIGEFFLKTAWLQDAVVIDSISPTDFPIWRPDDDRLEKSENYSKLATTIVI
jgi:hypothetical protein